MSDLTLTETKLSNGVWEGVVIRQSMATEAPQIEVTHLQNPIEGVEVLPNSDQAGWVVRVPVPAHTINDGVQTFLIQDKDTGETIGNFAFISGEALAHDIRAEVTLLREELDMMKRAFRKHCSETM